MLRGDMMIHLQGVPIQEMDHKWLTDVQRYHLAGEGIFLPCIATIIFGVFLNAVAPW